MKCGIIRGIWGDESASRGRVKAPLVYSCLLDDATHAIEEGKEIGDRIYCYGKQNAKFITDLNPKCGVELLDDRPWMTPKFDGVDRGLVRFGANTFWHKWMIMDVALQEFDAVVWIDFNMSKTKCGLPADFWKHLNSGPSIQAALAHQPSSGNGAGWRAWYKQRKWDIPELRSALMKGDQEFRLIHARMVPQCAWLYVRGRSVIKELLQIQDKYPGWMNQQCVAYYLDINNTRKWMGVDEYIRRGHNTPSKWYWYESLLLRPKYSHAYWIHEDTKRQEIKRD